VRECEPKSEPHSSGLAPMQCPLAITHTRACLAGCFGSLLVSTRARESPRPQCSAGIGGRVLFPLPPTQSRSMRAARTPSHCTQCPYAAHPLHTLCYNPAHTRCPRCVRATCPNCPLCVHAHLVFRTLGSSSKGTNLTFPELLDVATEKESLDRDTLLLPGVQMDLVKVCVCARGGKVGGWLARLSVRGASRKPV
jgi:hypothetical protein